MANLQPIDDDKQQESTEDADTAAEVTDIDDGGDKKDKKKKKKKKKKWDLEEHLGSVEPPKLKIKFDANRGQDTLKQAGWWVNRRGKVVALDDGAAPTPNDCPETYVIQQYISYVLTDEQYYNYKLIRIKQNEELKVARANIYVSPDYNRRQTVLLVICGTGVVNAGEFATSVCKFDNIIVGSAFPFMEWARERDIGVVLFDPNTLSKHHENVLDEIHCVYVFDTYVKPYLAGAAVNADDSNNNNNNNADDDDEKKNTQADPATSVIQNLLILAHSAGGRRTTFLLKERGDIVQQYVKAIAFTDIKDPKEQLFKYQVNGADEKAKAQIAKKIYQECAVNWVKSKEKKLDEPMKKMKGAVCKRVSSGHSEHKYTTPNAYSSIVKFFDERQNASNQ